MTEKRSCVRCSRAIDAWAKICPYCNWDQALPAPEHEVVPAPVANYVPPSEYDVKKKLIMAAIGVLVLVASFGIGMVINRDGAPKNAPETVEEQAAEERAEKALTPIRRADTPLVPMNEPGGIDQPITSAPVAAEPGALPNDYQRTDATAVSATEYAEMAKRARAEKERMSVVVDPRSLTGSVYAQTPRPVARRQVSTPAPMPAIPATAPTPGTATQQQQDEPAAAASAPPRAERQSSLRTRPVPQYQPLPNVSGHGTARLSLLIGADGRVKQVSIQRALQGNTAQLIAAVQTWRFKPATENGEPVSAPYSVEISFR